MKKITLTLLSFFIAFVAICETPKAINYQAVAINVGGNPIKNKNIKVRFSILKDSPSGNQSYQETHVTSTDANGLFSLKLGQGTPTIGVFANIKWATGNYFLKTEIDTTSGDSYFTMGTVQMLSVPYAFYADKAARNNISTPEFPDGIDNAMPIKFNGSFTYTVPAGKTFYCTSISFNNAASPCKDYSFSIDGFPFSASSGPSAFVNVVPESFVVGEGRIISSSACGIAISGFEVPKYHDWIYHDLSAGNYTVPAGKVLVLKQILKNNTSQWDNYLTVSGATRKYNEKIQIINENEVISATGMMGGIYLVGYLKDK